MLNLVGVLVLGVGVTPAPAPCATLEGCLALVNTSKAERCVEALHFASKTWPDSLQAQHGLALCLDVLGRSEEAAAAARRCLKLQPTYAPCLSLLGTSLWTLGQRREGRECLERVVSAQIAEGRYPHALTELAEWDIEEGQSEAARKHLDLAWGLAKENRTKARLHVVEGKLALLQGDGIAALKHFQAGGELRGGAEFRVLQAVALAWQGSFAEARNALGTTFDSAVQARWRTVGDSLAAVLARKADIQALRRWVQADPTEEHAWFLLALELHFSGDDQGANRVLVEGRHRAGTYLLQPRWDHERVPGLSAPKEKPP